MGSQLFNIKSEYRIFGLRRTGNHAIINWINQQLVGKTLFLNDQELDQPIKGEGFTAISDCEKHLIHSYEEQRFSKTYLRLNDIYLENANLIGKQRFNILILRDPFNLFASRLKSGYVTTWRTPRLNQVDLWILYAMEFLGETNYLPNKVCINYNLWVEDKEYRKTIARKLRLNFTDAGYQEVSAIGGGSSFDGVAKNNDASQMQLMNRWENYKEDKEFQEIFKSKLMITYYKKIFPVNEKITHYIKETLLPQSSFRSLLETLLHTRIYPPLLEYKLKERKSVILK